MHKKFAKLDICPIIISLLLLTFSSCVEKKITPKMEIDAESSRASYGSRIEISPLDDSVTISRGKITISPTKENVTYTISGYFDGQIVTTSKNTILRLNNAFIENRSGNPAIKANAKIEISTAKDSVNYIVTRGQSFAKIGAVQNKRDLVLGGSGTLNIKGICHGVEAEDVKIKGSGNIYIEGTRKGSAITCEDFTVEAEKSFAAYLLNSKNGIKADDKIIINSGNFHLYNNGTALKTDLSKENKPKTHSVKLAGGNFYLSGNENFVVTDEAMFDSAGATLVTEMRN